MIAEFPVEIVELHDWMLPSAGSSLGFKRWQASHDRDLLVRGENLFSLANRKPSPS